MSTARLAIFRLKDSREDPDTGEVCGNDAWRNVHHRIILHLQLLRSRHLSKVLLELILQAIVRGSPGYPVLLIGREVRAIPHVEVG